MTHRLAGVFKPGFLTMKDSVSGDRQIKYFTTKTATAEFACVASVRAADAERTIDSLGAVWPAYCFREQEPELIASHENGTVTNFYGRIQKSRNHYFPGDIGIWYAGKKRVQATLEELKDVDANDEAFTPSALAKEPAPPTIVTAPTIKLPMPIRRVEPVYPLAAHAAHVGGTVVIAATIGKDGKIKDAKIVSSPEASLSSAALDAVEQWRYEPTVLAGQPIEVHTTISLSFKP